MYSQGRFSFSQNPHLGLPSSHFCFRCRHCWQACIVESQRVPGGMHAHVGAVGWTTYLDRADGLLHHPGVAILIAFIRWLLGKRARRILRGVIRVVHWHRSRCGVLIVLRLRHERHSMMTVWPGAVRREVLLYVHRAVRMMCHGSTRRRRRITAGRRWRRKYAVALRGDRNGR